MSSARSASTRGSPVLRRPEGWVAGPPDYVGVGAARSGTGWWDALIAAHPRVARAPGAPRALHFFDERWATGLDEAAVSAYHAAFPRPPGSIAGEWTPSYMLDAWVPALLRRAAPDARLLVLLRDPVERFRSGRRGPEHPAQLGVTPRAAANAAFARGLYADQLLRLWAAFPRDRVLVLQYERCQADPAAELRRTYAFLGLDPEIAEGSDRRFAERVPDEPRSADRETATLEPWQEDVLRARYAPENERLAGLVPGIDLALWRQGVVAARR